MTFRRHPRGFTSSAEETIRTLCRPQLGSGPTSRRGVPTGDCSRREGGDGGCPEKTRVGTGNPVLEVLWVPKGGTFYLGDPVGRRGQEVEVTSAGKVVGVRSTLSCTSVVPELKGKPPPS